MPKLKQANKLFQPSRVIPQVDCACLKDLLQKSNAGKYCFKYFNDRIENSYLKIVVSLAPKLHLNRHKLTYANSIFCDFRGDKPLKEINLVISVPKLSIFEQSSSCFCINQAGPYNMKLIRAIGSAKRNPSARATPQGLGTFVLFVCSFVTPFAALAISSLFVVFYAKLCLKAAQIFNVHLLKSNEVCERSDNPGAMWNG